MLEQPVINLITTPLVAGVVGYITNKLAIKMLFRPYKPKWYTLGWQGIVPKTRPMLADKITLFGNMIVFSSYAMQVIMSFLMLAMIFMMIPRLISLLTSFVKNT